MASSSDTSDAGDIDIVNDVAMSDHDDDHGPAGNDCAPAMHTLQTGAGTPFGEHAGNVLDAQPEDPTSSPPIVSDPGDTDTVNAIPASNHADGYGPGKDDIGPAMSALHISQGRPANRKACRATAHHDEDSAASSTDASDLGDIDIVNAQAMSDHDDDHDPGGDDYAPTWHTSRAERAARRHALQPALKPFSPQPSRNINPGKDQEGRGPKRKQPPSAASQHPAQDAPPSRLLSNADLGQPSFKRRRKQSSSQSFGSAEAGVGPQAKATKSEQRTPLEELNDEYTEPASTSQALPALTGPVSSQRAPRIRKGAKSADAAGHAWRDQARMASVSPMGMMPVIPEKGDGSLAHGIKEEPDFVVRWPSPALSDSEYGAEPPRHGRKRHPKLRLVPKAVQRMNLSRRIKGKRPAKQQLLQAAVRGEGIFPSHHRSSVSKRARRPLILNESDRGHFGGWHQHLQLVTGADGKIVGIDIKSPEQDDSSGAGDADVKRVPGRAGQINRFSTRVIEPIPRNYLFREKWRPWLNRQVTFVGVRISDFKAAGRGVYMSKFDFKGTLWPEWRFGEYDDRVAAAKAHDRAAIAIYGPQRALTSFVIASYPKQDLVQRKGLDLLQFLGKLQLEAKQLPQLDSSNKCGRCLACLQPALLIPCLKQEKKGATGRSSSKPPPFIRVPQEHAALEEAAEQLTKTVSKQAVIPLRERRQHSVARDHALEAARKEVEGLLPVHVQKKHRQKVEPAQFSCNKPAADLRIFDAVCHPFIPQWSAGPAIELRTKFSAVDHAQWAFEELHSIFRCLARGELVKITPLEENPDAGACSRCSSMHHKTASPLVCPAYALCTTDHSLPTFTQAKVKAAPSQTAAVKGALHQFPGWIHLAQTLPESPFEELFAGAWTRLASKQQPCSTGSSGTDSQTSAGGRLSGIPYRASAAQAQSQPQANHHGPRQAGGAASQAAAQPAGNLQSGHIHMDAAAQAGTLPVSSPHDPLQSDEAAAQAASDSHPQVAGFQPWRPSIQDPLPFDPPTGLRSQQHQSVEASRRPFSKILPRPGPIDLRPWGCGHYHLHGRQMQGLPAGEASGGTGGQGPSVSNAVLSRQHICTHYEDNDEDDEEHMELHKGRLRPAFARVLHALQAYAGVLADDKGITATRRLMAADLMACGLLVERKLRQMHASQLLGGQHLHTPAVAHQALPE
ncbi:hypothetical protein WJX74_008059 [Apatococcus lobatus]|uniref:AP2/ERF domain-containing protein n=1 Tax=Apatococcus lobatus TaxID=904363 RepID=A0AAW1SFQ7_9CHLO